MFNRLIYHFLQKKEEECDIVIIDIEMDFPDRFILIFCLSNHIMYFLIAPMVCSRCYGLEFFHQVCFQHFAIVLSHLDEIDERIYCSFFYFLKFIRSINNAIIEKSTLGSLKVSLSRLNRSISSKTSHVFIGSSEQISIAISI